MLWWENLKCFNSEINNRVLKACKLNGVVIDKEAHAIYVVFKQAKTF